MRAKILDLWSRQFVRDVLHTLGSKGLILLVGIVSSILITRSLGPEGKGNYSLILTLIMIGMQFGHLGMHSSNTYAVARNRNLWGQLFSNSIYISIFNGIAICTILLGINAAYPQLFKLPSIPGLWVYLLLATPLGLMSLLFKNLLIGVQHIRQNNYFEILSRIVYVLFIILLYLSGYLSVTGAIIAYLIEHLTVILSEGWYQYRKAERPLRPSFMLFRSNLEYGIRAYIAVFLAFLVIRSDVLLVNYFLDKSHVGYYSTAVQVIDQFQILGAVVASILMPKLTGTDSLQRKFQLNMRVLRTVAIILLIQGALLILFAKPLFRILYGEPFVASVPAFRILVFAMIFLSLETILAQFVASIGMPVQIIWFWLICFLLNLVLNILWIPVYGEIGAAWASAVAYLLILLLVYVWIRLKVSRG